jgi:quercetin dioxygenase-like cupin family protein
VPETYFLHHSFPEVPLRHGGPSRRLLAFGGSLMLAEMDFETGAVSEAHAHPEEQLTYCASGKFETMVGDLPGRLEAGDSFYAGPAVPHGVRCLEKGKLLHVFTPQRSDYR